LFCSLAGSKISLDFVNDDASLTKILSSSVEPVSGRCHDQAVASVREVKC
jgi:hypothetical protein